MSLVLTSLAVVNMALGQILKMVALIFIYSVTLWYFLSCQIAMVSSVVKNAV